MCPPPRPTTPAGECHGRRSVRQKRHTVKTWPDDLLRCAPAPGLHRLRALCFLFRRLLSCASSGQAGPMTSTACFIVAMPTGDTFVHASMVGGPVAGQCTTTPDSDAEPCRLVGRTFPPRGQMPRATEDSLTCPLSRTRNSPSAAEHPGPVLLALSPHMPRRRHPFCASPAKRRRFPCLATPSNFLAPPPSLRPIGLSPFNGRQSERAASHH